MTDPTARERAINILEEGFGWVQGPAVAFVDAIIEAARAPESAHTREVKNLRQRGECAKSPHGFHERSSTTPPVCRYCSELL